MYREADLSSKVQCSAQGGRWNVDRVKCLVEEPTVDVRAFQRPPIITLNQEIGKPVDEALVPICPSYMSASGATPWQALSAQLWCMAAILSNQRRAARPGRVEGYLARIDTLEGTRQRLCRILRSAILVAWLNGAGSVIGAVVLVSGKPVQSMGTGIMPSIET